MKAYPNEVCLKAIQGLPLIKPGDNLVKHIDTCLKRMDLPLKNGDILVVTQKIVSKSEGRFVSLENVVCSDRAKKLAESLGKDPRLIEIILSESSDVLRAERTVLIVSHKLGFVMANAGVDKSNIDQSGGEYVLLLPEDPDRSAEDLRKGLFHLYRADIGVIISDSFGRAWRKGVSGVAIGVAGIPALLDLRQTEDLFGRKLKVTEVGYADEIASAAALLMGEADAGVPVVLVRGLNTTDPKTNAQTIVRPQEYDLFR